MRQASNPRSKSGTSAAVPIAGTCFGVSVCVLALYVLSSIRRLNTDGAGPVVASAGTGRGLDDARTYIDARVAGSSRKSDENDVVSPGRERTHTQLRAVFAPADGGDAASPPSGADTAAAVSGRYDLADVKASLSSLEKQVSSLKDSSSATGVANGKVAQALAGVQETLSRMGEGMDALAQLPDRVREACREGVEAAGVPAAGGAVQAAPERAAAVPAATDVKVYRNAIIGLAKDIPLTNAYRYVRSIRERVGWSVDIILFTDDTSGDLGWLYDAYRVKVIKFEVARLPPKIAGFHPSSYRWIMIRDWMRDLPVSERYDYVLFIDVRDSVFQADPFKHVEGKTGFFAFLEAKPGTIAGCGWNSGWVRDCFGDDALRQIGHNIISCSGSSMASWQDGYTYADMVATEVAANPCERNGVDQGMHQWFLYGGKLKEKASELHFITNEEGWIATVQSMPTLVRDRVGRVVNSKDEVVAVVHQYDRSQALKDQYDREFVWIPEHERRRK